MDFFISNAWAQSPPPGGGLAGFLPIILIFVIFYFVFIRPQQKRAKEHRGMVSALKKGDEVVLNGGIAGKIIEVGDSFLSVQIADNTDVKVQKHAIAVLLPKGTLKSG